ncbi:hypothetical protein EJB05_31217, partial [Eragrostis curvula]
MEDSMVAGKVEAATPSKKRKSKKGKKREDDNNKSGGATEDITIQDLDEDDLLDDEVDCGPNGLEEWELGQQEQGLQEISAAVHKSEGMRCIVSDREHDPMKEEVTHDSAHLFAGALQLPVALVPTVATDVQNGTLTADGGSGGGAQGILSVDAATRNAQDFTTHVPSLGPLLEKALMGLKERLGREEGVGHKGIATETRLVALSPPVSKAIKPSPIIHRRSDRRAGSVDEDSTERASRLVAIRNLEEPEES